jgi:hypothetical protein
MLTMYQVKPGSQQRSSMPNPRNKNVVLGNAGRLSSNSNSPNSTLGKSNMIYKNMRNISNLYKYEPETSLLVTRDDDQLRLGLKKVHYIAPLISQSNQPIIKAENGIS